MVQTNIFITLLSTRPASVLLKYSFIYIYICVCMYVSTFCYCYKAI